MERVLKSHVTCVSRWSNRSSEFDKKRTVVTENETQIDTVCRTQAGVAGGQIELGAQGVLLRWCVTSYTWSVESGESFVLGGDTLKQTLSGGRHVPLPLDRLWVVSAPLPSLPTRVTSRHIHPLV